ncbi:MAG: restriction endonuclease subunit S [Candidatus Bipolaricaulota bacterium]|nr:restriction endonuclease subunit S [Candidatus Bipolaricaulota bacterium]
MGQSPPGETCNTDGRGLPLLNGPTEYGAHHPVPVQFTTDARKRASTRDLLFCVRGSTTGRMNWADREYAIGRGVAAIRHRTNPELQPLVRAVIEYGLPGLLAQATGSTFPNVSADQLANVWWPALDDKAQLAIASILGTLDDKIELNRRMNETLEAMARALFKSWFVDFDPVHAKAEGRDTGLPPHVAELFPDSFEDSELGEIPKGWEVQPLGGLGALAIGGDWGEDEAFAGAVRATCLRGVDLEHLRRDGDALPPRRWFRPASLERRAMDERDVLIAGSGAGPTGRSLWMCRDLLLTLAPCVYSNFCKRIRCNSAAQAVYADAWLHGMRESGEVWEYVNGTSVPNLDANALLAGKVVPVPRTAVLDAYCEFVGSVWRKKYAGMSDTLAALRDALLPKLISGAVRVHGHGVRTQAEDGG